jgi:CRP-like cAMP-binding protein
MAVERLEKQEIFKHLRPDQMARLSDAAQVMPFKDGKTVYHRGAKANNFYIVLKGQVALRLPGKGGMNVLIDQLGEGNMFGGCVSAAMDSYALTAICTEESEILRIEAAALKNLMDEEPRMGYMIQSQISQIYFKRYIETMEKLQAIVLNIPLERD